MAVAAAEVGLGGEEAVDASCFAVAVVQEADRNLCTYPCCGDFGDPPVECFNFIVFNFARLKCLKIHEKSKTN